MAVGNVSVLRDRLVESGANDPLLSALVDKLPPAGTTWSPADRQAWLTMAANAFDVVYGAARALPSPASAPRAGAAPKRPARRKPARKPARSRPKPPKPLGPTGPSFFIDRQGFARKRGGERIMPAEVLDHIVDLRGEKGDLGAITWADDTAGIPRGLQLDVTIA